MVEAFTIVQVVVAVAVGVWCVARGIAGRGPDDVALIGAVAVEVMLLAQVVVALVAPAVGNTPTGSVLEFWMYLISAVLIPVAAIAWALVDRARWSMVVLGIGLVSVSVMVYRMQQIWVAPVASS